MKKILMIMMALSVVGLLAAGCGGGENNATDTNTATDNAAATE